MTVKDSVSPAKAANRYHEAANSIRALIPLMQYAAVSDQLSVLAVEYDKLAACIEAASESLQTLTGRHIRLVPESFPLRSDSCFSVSMSDLLHGVLSRAAVAARGGEVLGILGEASCVVVFAVVGRPLRTTQLIVRALQIRRGVTLGIALVSSLDHGSRLCHFLRRLALLRCTATGEYAQQWHARG